MVNPSELTKEEIKAVIDYADRQCGFAISDAVSYKYDGVDLNECFGEFEDADFETLKEVRNYVDACDYVGVDDNGASEWLNGKY